MKCSNNCRKFLVKFNILMYMAVVAAFILLAPFIYPLLSALLINIGIFESVDQLNQYIGIFKNFYMVAVVIIVVLIFILCFSKKEILSSIVKNIKITYKHGENTFEVGPFSDFPSIDEKKKKFQEAEIINEESNFIKKEVQQKLNITANESTQIEMDLNDKKVEDLKIQNEELEYTLRNIRFFSAYSVTNTCCRKLLLELYNNNNLKKEVFNSKLLSHYKKRFLKKLPKDKSDQYAQSKKDELIFDLVYLDILEHSEDDKYFVLTENGLEFVEKYLKGDGEHGI